MEPIASRMLNETTIRLALLHSNRTQRERAAGHCEVSDGPIRISRGPPNCTRVDWICEVSHVIKYDVRTSRKITFTRLGGTGREWEAYNGDAFTLI